MACMGPNKKYSDKLAKKATQEVLDMLVEKYGFRRTCEGYFMDDFLKGKDKLEEAMKDLFWTDACDSF
jgi:hypothetical protein